MTLDAPILVVFTNPRDHTQGFRTAPIWMCCDQTPLCGGSGVAPHSGPNFSQWAPQLRPKRGWPCSTSFPRHVVVFTNPRDHTQGFRTAPIWMCCDQKPPRGAALPMPHFGAADPNFSCPEVSPKRGWPCSTSFPRHVVGFTNPRDHTQGFRTAPIWMCCDQTPLCGGSGVAPHSGPNFSEWAPQLSPERGWPCSTSFPRYVWGPAAIERPGNPLSVP